MVIPTSVFVQKLNVPAEEEIIAQLSAWDLCLIDALAIAREAGSPLSINVVMLGAASPHLPLGEGSLSPQFRGLCRKYRGHQYESV
jgi:indolepyruvate ferredoxin oxidoreductase beta subunit